MPRTVPWHKWLVAGLTLWRPAFDSRPVPVCLVDGVTLGWVFFQVLGFSYISVSFHWFPMLIYSSSLVLVYSLTGPVLSSLLLLSWGIFYVVSPKAVQNIVLITWSIIEELLLCIFDTSCGCSGDVCCDVQIGQWWWSTSSSWWCIWWGQGARWREINSSW